MTGASALIDGGIGGAIATVAMSAVMVAGDRTGVMGEQPPTAITRFALGEAGVERPSVAASRLAPFTHLAFGVLGGAAFGLLRRLFPAVPGGLLGVGFGLAVWAISYKGSNPRVGNPSSAGVHRPGRPVVMVVAHVVYGLVLGRLVRP